MEKFFKDMNIDITMNFDSKAAKNDPVESLSTE